MNTGLLMAGTWNEPFLLVACLGNVLLRCNRKEGTNLADCAIWRDEKHLRLFDTTQPDVISKVVTHFRDWTRDGFDVPFVLYSEEANVIYHALQLSAQMKAGGIGSRANIDAIIRRWVRVDIFDPGQPVVVGHFDEKNGKRVRPRSAYNLPRDVHQAVDAYLLAYEPGHARAYVHSWKRAQEITP